MIFTAELMVSRRWLIFTRSITQSGWTSFSFLTILNWHLSIDLNTFLILYKFSVPHHLEIVIDESWTMDIIILWQEVEVKQKQKSNVWRFSQGLSALISLQRAMKPNHGKRHFIVTFVSHHFDKISKLLWKVMWGSKFYF